MNNEIKESTEGQNTEQKEGISNSNISLEDIYNAIRNLNAKHQGIILGNYKILELYEIFADNEQYRQYINDLFAISSVLTC